MLSWIISLYILNINQLYNILFSNMFYCSVGGLFISLIVSFTGQKFLIWGSTICLCLTFLFFHWSHIQNNITIGLLFWIIHKYYYLDYSQVSVSLQCMFISRSIIISDIKFQFLIHF